MTEKIALGNTPYWGIEYDVRLAEYLQQTFAGRSHLHIICGDGAKIKISQDLLPSHISSWICFGNLPYNVATPILINLIHQPQQPDQILLLLQKEMAQRLLAGPGNKTYGSMTIQVGLYYDVQWIRAVPPSVFWPVPEVDSAIILLHRKPPSHDREFLLQVERLVRHCFIQRRKTLKNRLKAFGLKNPECVLSEIGISPQARPEQLTLQQYILLMQAITPHLSSL
ncbi:MAG: ribosomal RNA small subunit methyltransferase A [Lentisphaerae bacterium]|nr:MAG: ribosomal RNA small subunit methyltransferase A [Lentisphaerota bacterium]